MSTPIKNPTPWRPVSGKGFVKLIGNAPICVVKNSVTLPLVDNAAKLPILTTPTITIPKYPTTWTKVG